MISQFAPRPVSRRLTNLRPVTGKASQANVKQSDQCFQIGKMHMAKKQYDQALKHYTNATIHNPSNYKALCNMGSIYKQKGKFSEARICYYKAIYANPNDQIALYNLGNLERISGNDQQAINLYQKVISLKQKNVNIGALYYDTLINLGICYKNLQMYDDAIKWNERASQENSKDQSAFFNQSMCLMKKIYGLLKGNFVSVKKKLCKDVKPLLDKVLQINPNNFGPKIALIQLKYLENPGQESYNAAIKQFQNLIKLVPEQDKNEVSLKIKYCQNQLKMIESNKIILPPKQDIVEYEQIKKQETTNKYDIKPAKTQIKKPNAVQNPIKSQNPIKNQNPIKQPLQRAQTPSAVVRKPSVPTITNKQTIQQNKDNRKKIQKLIEQKKFEEAFELSREMPDGSEKYQIQIIINYLECIQTENDRFLESAVAIYRDYIFANQQSRPITKDSFSEKGHQVMATMLTVYGQYQQASKHYEILLSMKQDHKFEKNQDKKTEQNKLKQIHAQLGVCYAERGLINQAIKQYKKSLEMQPTNYFLMTNLCGLLINDNKKPEALQYYEAYLNKNGGENIPNKVQLVDCLLNISICLRDTPEQEKAIQKTIDAIQKNFGDYESKRANLHEQAILGVYLRQAEILQKKSEKVTPSSPQKHEYYSKLLDSYLTCLQFENCPDRQAICINVGILFYLNGCYVNALNFYKTIVLNKKMIANNIGLTYLHLHEYEKALTCFSYACSENPQNIIYALNLQISKWICGLNDTNIVYKYPCKCEIMVQNREALGLWIVDELTNMIDNNELEIQIYDSNQKFAEQLRKLIKKILDKGENKNGLSESDKNKLAVIEEVFSIHNKNWHKSGEQITLSQKPVPSQILQLSLKKYSNQKQFETVFGQILDILLKTPQSPQFLTIVQASLLLLIIKNPHIQKMNQVIRELVLKKKIFTFTQKIESLQNEQFKNNPQNGFIGKKVQIKDVARDLNYKLLHSTTRDVQCLIQNLSEYVMQHVEKTYYFSPSVILQPLVRSYKIPHCENVDECVRCVISSSQLYSTLFKKKIDFSGEKILKESFKTYAEEEKKFINRCLENEQNKVYSKENQTLTLELNKRIMPFVIRTRHKKYSDVKQFINRIDKSFKIPQETSEKGVRQVQINKSVVLQLWWGENITYVDRFCHWLCSRSTNLYHDALFLMAEEAELYNLK